MITVSRNRPASCGRDCETKDPRGIADAYEGKGLVEGGPALETIDLRPLEDSDHPLMEKWLMKPHVRRWFGESDDWLKEIRQRRGQFSFLHHFIAWIGDTPIGFCQYYACADVYEEAYRSFPKAGTYSIDYLIGEEAFLGKKLGISIIRKLVDRVFAIDGAERIVVQPESGNVASSRALYSAGFLYNSKVGVYVLKNRKDAARTRP